MKLLRVGNDVRMAFEASVEVRGSAFPLARDEEVRKTPQAPELRGNNVFLG